MTLNPEDFPPQFADVAREIAEHQAAQQAEQQAEEKQARLMGSLRFSCLGVGGWWPSRRPVSTVFGWSVDFYG